MTTLREQIDKHMTGFPGSLWDCIEYYADENVVGTQRQSFIEAALKELESLLTTHAEQEIRSFACKVRHDIADKQETPLMTDEYHDGLKDAMEIVNKVEAARKQGKEGEYSRESRLSEGKIMTVYIITSIKNEWDASMAIDSVWGSKTLAEEYVTRLRHDCGDKYSFDIDEREVENSLDVTPKP
jgi:hypothetical protein